MKDNIQIIWPDFVKKEEIDTQVISVSVDRERSLGVIELCLNAFSADYIKVLNHFFSEKYNTVSLKLKIRYDRDSFGADACRCIIKQMADSGMPLNGFFDDCGIDIHDSSVVFDLKHGGLSVLKEVGFSSKFASSVNESFGFSPTVDFTGALELDEMQLKLPEDEMIVNVSEKESKKNL